MFNERVRKGTACALALAFVLTAFVPFCLLSEGADADGAVEPDYTHYRYTINFYSTSTDTMFLIWDFGDGTVLDGRWEHYIQLQDEGTELSDELKAGVDAYTELLRANGNSIYCPVHTFAQKGTYIVEITAINPVGYVSPTTGLSYDGFFSTDCEGFDGGLTSGSDDPSVCGAWDASSKVTEIRGYPVITFMTEGGSEIEALTVENTNVYTCAEEPEAPCRDGFDFCGWFLDEDCTEPYDWSQKVTKDITLYAGWIASGTDEVTVVVNGSPVTFENGKKVSDLVASEKDGFEFAGWYSDEACTVPVEGEAELCEGMILFAKYNAKQVEPEPPVEEPKDEPVDEPTDDPSDEPQEDDSGQTDSEFNIVPYAVSVLGILLMLVGIRFHPALVLLGLIATAAGGLDISGIMEIF